MKTFPAVLLVLGVAACGGAAVPATAPTTAIPAPSAPATAGAAAPPTKALDPAKVATFTGGKPEILLGPDMDHSRNIHVSSVDRSRLPRG